MIGAMIELLATGYQMGNPELMEMAARSLLTAIPDDLVGLQFLGLALYLQGRLHESRRVLARSAKSVHVARNSDEGSCCEAAASACLRTATYPGRGLADAWNRIADLMRKFGLTEAKPVGATQNAPPTI